MQWLATLLCPRGGLVLDPFTGTGTTGIGARRAGRRFLGMEQSHEFYPIGQARLHYHAPR
jgi:site-specific DNA-methyltransferase (adenine-specific)